MVFLGAVIVTVVLICWWAHCRVRSAIEDSGAFLEDLPVPSGRKRFVLECDACGARSDSSLSGWTVGSVLGMTGGKRLRSADLCPQCSGEPSLVVD